MATTFAFLDALFTAFPTPQGPPPASSTIQKDAEALIPPAKAKKRPAPAASRQQTPPPRPAWMDKVEDGFVDPFSTPHFGEKEAQLLRVLCVDHMDLLEATEREKTRSAVGAVVTTKRSEPKKKAAKATPAQQLLQHCTQYIASTEFAVFSDAELAETIVQTVEDARGQEDLIQSHLFGLVGVEGMDLIAFVMQHTKDMGKGGAITRQTLQDAVKQQQLLAGGSARPAVASSFSIQTATEQLQHKQQRKAQRKARAQAGGSAQDDEDNMEWLEAAAYDLEVLRLQRQFEEEEKRNDPTSLLLREFGELRGGYDTTGAAGQLTSAGMLSLPSSTKRTYYKGYEHVYIPAHAKKALGKGETLVPINQLEAFAQTAFKGMKTLNRLQSKLFDAAYSTNQNLLVCAPTGAGKTNVAMLTILQQIKSHLQRHERNPLSNMKIIYVAPMKALAQEVVTKFGERLRDLKLKVAELTGDMQMTKKEIEETHLIVTTPEKWDVITRKSSAQQALLSQVKLLIIDEVHLLADQRGPVIETIVARTLRRVESTQSMIRIVGLSATLPNYADVATFLRVYVPPGDANAQNAAVNGGKGGLFFFDSTYRPVPLDQTFIGVSTSGNGLKDALNMSANQLTKTLKTEEDRAKSRNTAPSNMSKLRQVQLLMNKLALVHCVGQVRNNEQVMVFVHSRKDTAATMRAMIELATNDEEEPDLLEAFLPPQDLPKMSSSLMERLAKSRNKEVKDLFTYGLGIHHAGMLRSDRNLTEELFEKGYIRVLCCTATLAWGVNLPAHSVLIKGTQVYNADKGGMTQLSMLDVMQIFGRAGRPQYDNSGDAVLMTTQDQLPHYLRLLTTGIPMESALIKALPDHLNAEIVSGTVTNLDEACEWLSYTYLYVRMKKNPLSYGLKYDDVQGDPLLIERRKQLLMDAAEKLQACRMIKILKEKTRLDQPDAGKIVFAVTSIGRVASHFYIQHTSIQTFNDLLDTKSSSQRGDDDNDLDWEKALLVLCSSNEFEQLKAREEEMNELEKLKRNFCRFEVRGGGIESYTGKTNVLLQALIGRARVSSFTLISDTNYVAQNASRVCRALFEICLKKHSARQADMFLQLANSIDQKMWWDQSLLLQLPNIPMDVVGMVEQQRFQLYDALAAEPHEMLDKLPAKARKWVTLLPFMDVEDVLVQPFGGNMLRISYALRPLFHEWREHAVGGRTLTYWLWVEDAVTGFIYHSEYVALHQSRFLGWKEGTQSLDMECFVPVFVSSDNNEANYVIRLISDRFVGIETYYDVTYTPDETEGARKKTEKEKENEMYTKLLTLHPQPLQSLQNPVFQSLYVSKFQFFNPIQTQAFHQLYHQDGNVLLCAPTGSGKTMCAELAMLRVWNKVAKAEAPATEPSLIVYIAPLKALAREKVADWKALFEHNRDLRKKVVEVTGDTLVNVEYLLNKTDIVVTTPEKWDLLTRNVSVGRQLMRRTALVIVDEVHLVGEAPRGAVLEVLVSRLRRFRDGNSIRLLGLSTALANAHDVGHWLGITKDNGGEVYNFRASVRPVPMEVHIQGFPERHFVARMAAMNKPTFMAIRTHSPEKPALVFVSSKAQTKLTALDLISFCVAQADSGVGGSSGGAKPFLKVDDSVMDAICNGRGSRVVDETLRHTLSFGIGLHHAGLARSDRELVEKLFRDKMIQVVISTSTLAWGVNLPAHLVVIKGTEYFQNGRYRSYPLSDLLQMIGRAGRPLLDTKGVACVLVEESKKNMIQRLLYEPLAIESTLGDHLENHLNAEIASGLVKHTKDVVQYLSWSLLFQRVVKNPSFYGYGQQVEGGVEAFFKELVNATVQRLVDSQCVTLDKKSGELTTTFLGKIAAALYIDVRSVAKMHAALTLATSQKRKPDDGLSETEYWQLCVLRAVCASCVEVLETTPLRHHEVQSGLAAELCAQVKFSPMTQLFTQPKKMMLETHGSEIKAFLLVQMHLHGLRMPSSDFMNDLRALLDQMPRLLSAAIDICALLKHQQLIVAGIQLSQGLVQGVWPAIESASSILTQLPHINDRIANELQSSAGIASFEDLRRSLDANAKRAHVLALVKKTVGDKNTWSDAQIKDLRRAVDGIPRFQAAVLTKPATAYGKNAIQVELKAVDVSTRPEAPVLANAHSRNRAMKPKPYGFYVLLTSTTTGETLQVKHVAWKLPRVSTQFAPVAVGGSYTVRIFSDAIGGIDQVVDVAGRRSQIRKRNGDIAMLRAVVRFARDVARLPSFPRTTTTNAQATGATLDDDDDDDDDEFVGSVLKIVATDAVRGQVLPSSDATWLALRPFHDLVDKKVTPEAKADRVAVRRAFIELLVRLAESGQFRWDATTMYCGDIRGPERSKTGENAFWFDLLHALWPEAVRNEEHPLERHLIALSHARRPRFLLCVDHDVSKGDVMTLLEHFLLPPDEDAEPVLYGPDIVDGLPDDDEWEGVEVEIGLSFTSGKISLAIMTELLDVIDRVYATRHVEGVRFRVTTLRFGRGCSLQPKAVELLGRHRQRTPNAVQSLRLGSFSDARASIKRAFFNDLTRGHACLGRLATSSCDSFVPLLSALRYGGAAHIQELDVHCSVTLDHAAWLAFALFHVDSLSSVTSLCLRVPRNGGDGRLDTDWLATFTRVVQSIRAEQDLAHIEGDAVTIEAAQAPTRTFVRLQSNASAKTDPLMYAKTLCNLGDTSHDEFELLIRYKSFVAIVIPGAGVGWVPTTAVISERSIPSLLPATGASMSMNRRIISFTWDACLPVGGNYYHHMQVLLDLLAIIGAPLHSLHLPGLPFRNEHLAQILRHCPNLTELNISGHQLEDIEPLEEAYRSGQCKIRSLSITRSEYGPISEGHLTPSMTKILEGPSRNILRRLLVHALPPISIRLDFAWDHLVVPLANAINSSSLEYVHQPGLTMYANQRQPFDFSAEPLSFSPMSLRCKLAFLSVISRFGSERCLGRLDASVLSVIFRFSYHGVARRVLKDAPMIVSSCICNQC